MQVLRSHPALAGKLVAALWAPHPAGGPDSEVRAPHPQQHGVSTAAALDTLSRLAPAAPAHHTSPTLSSSQRGGDAGRVPPAAWHHKARLHEHVLLLHRALHARDAPPHSPSVQLPMRAGDSWAGDARQAAAAGHPVAYSTAHYQWQHPAEDPKPQHDAAFHPFEPHGELAASYCSAGSAGWQGHGARSDLLDANPLASFGSQALLPPTPGLRAGWRDLPPVASPLHTELQGPEQDHHPHAPAGSGGDETGRYMAAGGCGLDGGEHEAPAAALLRSLNSLPSPRQQPSNALHVATAMLHSLLQESLG